VLYKSLFAYIVLILLFGTGIYGIVRFGSDLHTTKSPEVETARVPALDVHKETPGWIGFVKSNLRHPLSILLLQILTILLAARFMASLFEKIHQPPVIGEVIAGILLGPSLLGLIFPETKSFLFPDSSMDTLGLLSQTGVILFMFAVGLQLNPAHFRGNSHTVVLVSHASIIVPFFLGSLLSLWIYPRLAPADIPFSAFTLFIGVAMSITAFPVLARILEERGLTGTRLGNTAIACAAVDDVSAWCLLATIVAIVRSREMLEALFTIVLTLGFILLMLFVIKPRIYRLLGGNASSEADKKWLLAKAVTLIFVCALVTELIGIHALFGAFLAGVVMPSDAKLRAFLREKLEMFSAVLLLPIFFAFTGLRTHVNLLNGWTAWLICGVIIAVAIIGKLGGGALAARLTGMNWYESLSLGALMNTRGLVELVVLNIGYDLGLLSPIAFAMMVVMALFTTFMTGPLIDFLNYKKLRGAVPVAQNA
jgi:Kef-type K+ transport system membrane component KefB